MTCPVVQIDPLDTRKVTVDFATWLGTGSSISSVAWTVPSGLTQENSSNTTTAAVNYFSGGTEGQEYEVGCTITTGDSVPREKTQRFLVRVESCC